ncbi:MAG: phosphonate ABC transporter, permease protein PhnE, partial [Sphingomonas sp.]|uniref:phosphonate ABC transporter, permease protein PhnE n=1 Tax=Sphingomonas sp. TaxID=28214 RepID=UPI001AD5EC5A|nr:phosphonate ABC transporter, permease protein PhnE [Sphingomonas sp.]MBN8847439.1 phosphonate ABC transporter, permease protein PhnE [Sphingomonas sp.]
MTRYASGFARPNFEQWPYYIEEMLVTIQIALWGTFLAVVLAVPFGILSARNMAPWYVVQPVRRLMDLFRAIHEMVFAVLFVVAVGLGPFAGVMALFIHTTGILAKLFSEAVEAIDPRPVEAIRATGASPLQEVVFGVVPQVMPLWISYTLYRFEANVRSASVVGMVGAGGIGGANGQSVNGQDGAGGAAGFGGGVGSSNGSGGGGGSGYGGAIFVRSGGALHLTGNGLIAGNTVLGGSSTNGGQSGNAVGSGLFIMTGADVVIAPGTGHVITVLDTIADDSRLNLPDSSIATGFGAGVHITGGGTVQFFGANTYSGTTSIEGGTLEAQDGIGINTNSHIDLAGSGTIGQGLDSTTAGVLLSTGTITRRLGSGSTQLSWSGSGGFAATADGLTLNFGGNLARQSLVWGVNSFVPDGSTLVFGSDALDATGAVTLLNTIDLNGLTGRIAVFNNIASNNDYAVLSGAVTNGRLLVNDAGYAGSLFLTAQNSLSGITVNDGLVSTTLNGQVGRLMNAQSGGDVTVNGGTLLLAGAEHLTSVDVTAGSLVTLSTITANSVTNAYGGLISFGGTTTTDDIDNSGMLLIHGSTTAHDVVNHSDGVTSSSASLGARSVLNDGTWLQSASIDTSLQFTNNGLLAILGSVDPNTNAQVAATRTITTGGFAGGASGIVQLGGSTGLLANTLVIDQSGDSIYAGSFTGAGSLTKLGVGTLTLTGANDFTGGLAISGGTLDTTGGGTLADTLAVTVAPASTYIVGTADTIGSISNAGSVISNADLALGTLDNSGTVTVNAGFTSAGRVTNTADGTIYLASTSTPAFASLANNGLITADAPLTIEGEYIQNAGSLSANVGLSSGTLSGTGGAILLADASVHYAIDQSADGTYAGSLTGGVVDKSGLGKLTLSGAAGSFAPIVFDVIEGPAAAASTHVFGSQMIAHVGSEGGLDLSADQAIALLDNYGIVALRADLTTSGPVMNNGLIGVIGSTDGNGTETMAATRTIVTAGFNGGSTGLVQLGGLTGNMANSLVIDQSGNSNYAGSFTGAGSLIKTGSGTLTLTGASNFTGGLAINGGTLDTTGGGTLADTLAVTVGAAGTYTVGTADIIGALTNGGHVTANADFVVASLANTGVAAFNGNFGVQGDVTNGATGVLTLAANKQALIAGALNNSGSLTSGGTLQVAGAVTNASGGSITLQAGSSTQFGNLLNNGAITADAALSTGTLSGTTGSIAMGSNTLSITQAANAAYAGSITGTGSVVKTGSGTLTLNGAAGSFAPASLTIQQGTVAATTQNNLASTLTVNIQHDGALSLGADQAITTLFGNGSLNLGTNVLTLSAGGTFSGQIGGSGTVNLQSGTFTLNNNGTSQSQNFTVNPDSVLNIAQGSTVATNLLQVSHATLNLMGSVNTTTARFDGAIVQLGNGVDLDQSGATKGSITATTTYVMGGSILRGNGSVTGQTIVGGQSAGTIAPGNSPGIMTFGDLKFTSNSVAAMQIDGPGAAGVAGGHDLIHVTGTLTLDGSSVLALQKSLPASNYQIPLGTAVQIFDYAPGHVVGHFGSVTKTGHTPNLIFNLSDGTVVSLGNNTLANLASATANANLAAALGAMVVSTNGDVPQYYGGSLLAPLLSSYGAGGAQAMNATFNRWAPGGYANMASQMQTVTLQSLPEFGGYKHLAAGQIIATGDIHSEQIETQSTNATPASRLRNTSFNVGFSGDLRFARVNLTYGHNTGNFGNDYIRGDIKGDIFAAGLSVPLSRDQALRLTGRLVYGRYDTDSTRQTLAGTAKANGVKGDSWAYGGGLEYHKETGRLIYNGELEYLALHRVTDGFTETGTNNPLNLFAIDRSAMNSGTGLATAKLGYALSSNLIAYTSVRYEHDFGSTGPQVVAHNLADPVTVTLNDPGLAKDRVNGDVGLRVNLASGLQFNVYGSMGTRSSHRFGGGVRMTF